MQLQTSTWQEVEGYLTGSSGVIIPIGSTEQHGPTGLIGTDAITAEIIAARAGEITGALVTPTIAVGMAEHHMGFPGSMTLRPSTLVSVICDNVHSLARHGFTRMMFVNGHGGNIGTVSGAFYEAYATAPPGTQFHCKLVNWFTGRKVAALAKQLYGDSEGGHATPSEVAVTQAAYPDAIKHAALDPKIAPSGRFYGPEHFRRQFPDGRMGSDPSLATPEHGERFIELAAQSVADAYTSFLAED